MPAIPIIHIIKIVNEDIEKVTEQDYCRHPCPNCDNEKETNRWNQDDCKGIKCEND